MLGVYIRTAMEWQLGCIPAIYVFVLDFWLKKMALYQDEIVPRALPYMQIVIKS